MAIAELHLVPAPADTITLNMNAESASRLQAAAPEQDDERAHPVAVSVVAAGLHRSAPTLAVPDLMGLLNA